MARTTEQRRTAYWQGALRHAERAVEQHEAIRARMDADAWMTPAPHTISWAEMHARVSWLVWDARRHLSA